MVLCEDKRNDYCLMEKQIFPFYFGSHLCAVNSLRKNMLAKGKSFLLKNRPDVGRVHYARKQTGS